MKIEVRKLASYAGRPIEDFSKKELVVVIENLLHDRANDSKERNRRRKILDAPYY